MKVEGAPLSRFPFPDHGVAGPKLCKARPRPLSPQPADARRMIDRGSIAGLHEHRHELRAYCPPAATAGGAAARGAVSQGKGSLRLPITVRCQQCVEVCRTQVRPPVLTWTNAAGWMESR